MVGAKRYQEIEEKLWGRKESGPAHAPDRREYRYAGFWIRLVAYILDNVIVSAMMVVVAVVLRCCVSGLMCL